MSTGDHSTRRPFFGALPTRGIWTAVELSRLQFLLILLVSVALFVFLNGPVWEHLREGHFARIILSYAAIPLMVLAAELYNRRGGPLVFVAAVLVIGFLKLVLTALLLMVLTLARG